MEAQMQYCIAKSSRLLITILSILTALSSSIVAHAGSVRSVTPQDAFKLTALSLSMADMPSNSLEIYNESLTIESINDLMSSSPIDLFKSTSKISLSSDYNQARIFSAVSLDNGVVIGSFSYLYPDSYDAQAIAEAVVEYLQNDSWILLPEYRTQKGSISAAKIVADKSGSTYWYVGTNDNVLITLFADGMSDQATHQLFDLSISKVVGKQVESVRQQTFLPFLQSGALDTEIRGAEINWRGPAYQVAWTHNSTTWPYLPHYGAWFIGRNGRSQDFICGVGPAWGYSSWNWWGNNRNVLLLEKRWLAAYPVLWNAGCHYATLDYP
jgi:hypothetical protein